MTRMLMTAALMVVVATNMSGKSVTRA